MTEFGCFIRLIPAALLISVGDRDMSTGASQPHFSRVSRRIVPSQEALETQRSEAYRDINVRRPDEPGWHLEVYANVPRHMGLLSFLAADVAEIQHFTICLRQLRGQG